MLPRPSWAPGILPPPAGFLLQPDFLLRRLRRAELRTWHQAQGEKKILNKWRGKRRSLRGHSQGTPGWHGGTNTPAPRMVCQVPPGMIPEPGVMEPIVGTRGSYPSPSPSKALQPAFHSQENGPTEGCQKIGFFPFWKKRKSFQNSEIIPTPPGPQPLGTR